MIKRPKIEQFHLHKDQPKKLQFELFSLNEYLSKDTAHTRQPHIHSFYQIIWFTHGTGKHFVDFDKFNVSPNTIFFISKNQIHYFDDRKDYQGVLIHFNEEFLMDNENDTDIILKHNLFNDFEREPYFTIPKTSVGNFENITASICTELGKPDNFAHKEYLQHLLKLFLISIQRLEERKSTKPLPARNQSYNIALKFRLLLESNYRSIHSVGEYAVLVNTSTKSLTNYTNGIFNKPPLRIINERITLEAKRLLCHSAFNINEIGFHLGFEDPSYFVKFFKKQTGRLPGDFKRSIS